MPSSASAPRRSTRTPAIKRAPGEETLSAHLRAHDRHRQSSRPLVSVLVGPESRAISLWRRWRRAQHGTTLVLREPSLAALCTQLNAHLCERGHLMEAALACIADAAKSPIERLRQRAEHLTEHELQLLRARAGLDPATDPHDCLVVAALDTARSGQPPTPQQLRERLKNTPACIDTHLLQRHGYLVLRFLAEDVVQEMFTVRNVILEAVRCAVSSPHAADRRERRE